MIRKVGGEYWLYASDGKRVLGKHKTRQQAVAQEHAINISKAGKPTKRDDQDREYALKSARLADEYRRKQAAEKRQREQLERERKRKAGRAP